jgi:prepilin peptidase CpaA
MSDLVTRWWADDDGQDLVEYALLVAFVGLAALAAWLAIQNALGAAYGRMDARQQNLSAVTPDPTVDKEFAMTLDFQTIAVLAVAVTSCAWDLRTRRIPNALTLGGALAAFAFAFGQNGMSGLAWSAAAWLTATALFFPLFALGGLGAGDVKLLGALGAWLGGVASSLYLACFTALAGGVMALAVMLARRYLREGLWNVWMLLMFWRTSGVRPLPELTLQGSRGPKLAYALPIAAGALTTLWLR